MLPRSFRFSAPLRALSTSKLRHIGSNSCVEAQLGPTLMAAASRSSPYRSFGSSCCPTPAPGAEAPSASDLGPMPSFLMSRAIRYSQVIIAQASSFIFPNTFPPFQPDPHSTLSCHRSSARSSTTGPSVWVLLAARPSPLLLSAATRARATLRLSSPKSAKTPNPF
jgi:hypothetical protein